MKGALALTRYLAMMVLLAGCAFASTVEITFASPIDLTASGSTTFLFPGGLGPAVHTPNNDVGQITLTFDADNQPVPEIPGYRLVGFDNFYYDYGYSGFSAGGSPLHAVALGPIGVIGAWSGPLTVPTSTGGPIYAWEDFMIPADEDGCLYEFCDAFPTPLTFQSFTTHFAFADGVDTEWTDPNDPAVAAWWSAHYPAEITVSGRAVFTVYSGVYESTPEPDQRLLVPTLIALIALVSSRTRGRLRRRQAR